ncbi:MAG: hypothetical protein L6R42_001907 [Xanthoria sp. 1 TBL-2021]|nr:MAG: hypothetical protein L6R42_001907 [Xanthoria sp. 1 TBL-2021]
MATTFTIPARKLTWLITGCSSGFGLALTRIVQAAGHKSKTNGGKGLELDVNDPTSPRFVDNLEQSGIEIDALINNAGYSIFAPVESTAEEELRA